MLIYTLYFFIFLFPVNSIAFLINNSINNLKYFPPKLDSCIFAHKTGTSNTRNNRDGNPKYLGLKKFHNMFVYTGNIIVRQRGAHFKPGIGAAMGRDFTIYAKRSGRLQILKRRISVLDLVSENEYLKSLQRNHECPTITTLSKLWTKKRL